MHLVTRSQFPSSDNDGGHTIRCARAKNSMLHANVMALFYRSRVIADRSFTLREYAFSTFLLMWLSPWPNNLHIRTRPVFHTGCVKMNFVCQCFRKLMYHYSLWMRALPATWQRWGDTIRSAIVENPWHTLTSWLFHRTGVTNDRIAGINIFDFFCSCDLDLDSMTFI